MLSGENQYEVGGANKSLMNYLFIELYSEANKKEETQNQ